MDHFWGLHHVISLSHSIVKAILGPSCIQSAADRSPVACSQQNVLSKLTNLLSLDQSKNHKYFLKFFFRS